MKYGGGYKTEEWEAGKQANKARLRLSGMDYGRLKGGELLIMLYPLVRAWRVPELSKANFPGKHIKPAVA